MENDNVLSKVRQLLDPQGFAVVATSHNGQPYTSLESFAFTDDLRSILFTTCGRTRKFKNIMEDARISVLVENRENKPSDITDARSVAALGRETEVKVAGEERLGIFLKKNPFMIDFTDDPDFALMEV